MDFKNVADASWAMTKTAGTWTKNNPGTAVALTIGAFGAGAVIAPAAVATPLLGAAGFTSGGVAAGSAAAGVQAGIGNVAAGSGFAILQSAGVAGPGLAVVNGVVQGAGGIVFAVASYCAVRGNRGEGGGGKKEGDGNEEPAEEASKEKAEDKGKAEI